MSLTAPAGEDAYHFGPFEIARSESFAKSQLSFAFVNLKPIVPGHVLVSPQRVARRFGDLNPAEIGDLWALAAKVGLAVESHFQADSLTFAIQDGPAAGQSVPHVHIHILPRRVGDFERNDQVYDAIEASSKEEAADRQGKKLHLDAERKSPPSDVLQLCRPASQPDCQTAVPAGGMAR
ncbi:hypothetical protein WJX84_005373 [Apatococcus fuscideae]|uniref:HIT domain-containing protein n=1 Tax=Apatococcus fuscideae TaxID=2026836 RepID=A0AAW1T9S3_9CHLO